MEYDKQQVCNNFHTQHAYADLQYMLNARRYMKSMFSHIDIRKNSVSLKNSVKVGKSIMNKRPRKTYCQFSDIL